MPKKNLIKRVLDNIPGVFFLCRLQPKQKRCLKYVSRFRRERNSKKCFRLFSPEAKTVAWRENTYRRVQVWVLLPSPALRANGKATWLQIKASRMVAHRNKVVITPLVSYHTSCCRYHPLLFVEPLAITPPFCYHAICKTG